MSKQVIYNGAGTFYFRIIRKVFTLRNYDSYTLLAEYVCLFLHHRLQFSGELIEDGREKGQYDVNTGQNNVSLKFIIGYRCTLDIT